MTFDQALLARCEQGLFALSWVAGTRRSPLAKEFRWEEIEAIDVPATCDRLRSAILSAHKTLQHTHTHTHTHRARGECSLTPAAAAELAIPFRVVSKLCYGTLRIYQQQVSNLMEMSRILVSRSQFKLTSLFGTKRKRSDVHILDTISKRRRVGAKSTQDTIITSYTELVNEFEQLRNWAQSENSSTAEQAMQQVFKGVTTKAGRKGRLASVKIREIMIREITADFCVPEIDEDSGFGVATADETSHFLDLFSERSFRCASPNCSPVERKSIQSSLDLPNTFHGCLAGIDSGTPLIKSEAANEEDCPIREEVNSPARITPEPQSVHKRSTEDPTVVSNAIPVAGTKDRALSKLIIDRIKQISHSAMRSQINNSKPFPRRTRIITIRKHMTTGTDVLSRSFFKWSSLKAKRKMSPEQAQQDYLGILNDILGYYPSGVIATEVHNNWAKTRKNTSRRRRGNPVKDEHFELFCEAVKLENVRTHKGRESTSVEPTLIDEAKQEWSAYGVWQKLVSTWQTFSDQFHDINATNILLSTKTRMNAAIAFSSLLTLAANRFIVITKAENSILMSNIKVGAASEGLISAI